MLHKLTKLFSVMILLALFLGATLGQAPLAKADEEKTIVDIAVEDGRFTTLVAALQAAGLVDTLKGEGPFTVFAPTDDAFAKLPAGTVDALLNDIPTLQKILLYHVVAGNKLNSSEVVEKDSIKTAQGEKITIKVTGGKVFLNDAQIIITDIKAKNGIIHVIDTVLIPPSFNEKDIVQIAVADGRFTTLVAALQAAGLVDTLKGEGPFTVFAPTDDAFAKLPAGTVDALLNDIPTLQKILLYHVVAGNKLDSHEVAEEDSIKTAQGERITVKVTGGKVFLNDAQIIITDIKAKNGIIHVIDTVLIPPSIAEKDIVDIAVEDGRFTTLVAALQAAGLVDTLKGEGPFTVFAPTDDAFAKLPAGTVDALLNDIPTLQKILLYHVVAGYKLDSAEVVEKDSIKTAQGEKITIKVTGGKVFLNDAQIIITDIKAKNGIIHVIDTVLIPPSFNEKDIVQIAVADGRFTTLVAALQAAGLVDTLKGEGPFTVFAPTDDAFAKLPAGTVDALLNDIPTLQKILLYHVVAGNKLNSSEVVEKDSIKTAQGEKITIKVTGGKVFLNDAQIIITDIKAKNGIIHVIDTVLIPPSLRPAPASVYVVHGIPGKDLGLDKSLPVDIAVNGECALKAFRFGKIAGPLSLPAGSYNIKISLANHQNPCANDAVIQADVPFAAGENISVVAHLNGAGAPTASKFANDVSSLNKKEARLVARHLAVAPSVDVAIYRHPIRKSSQPIVVLNGLNNGDSKQKQIGAGHLSRPLVWSVSPAGQTQPVLVQPFQKRVQAGSVTIGYIVGSPANKTLTVIEQRLDLSTH